MRPEVPLVGPLERTLHLQSLAMFEGLRSAQLARIAQLTDEEYFAKGSTLSREGEPPAAVHFLVEGTVEERRGGRVVNRRTAPEVVGLNGLIGGSGAALECVAATDLTSLAIEGNAFLDLIEDHFDLFLHFRKIFAGRVSELQRRTRVLNTEYDVSFPGGFPEPRGMVERLLYMQRAAVFSDVSVNALAQMIRDRDDVRADPGTQLWSEGDAGRSLLFIMEGEVDCDTADGSGRFRAGPGYVIGADATFGGIPYAYTARVTKPLRAIRVDAGVLNDIKEDHFDFALGTLAHFAREEVRLLERRAFDGAGSE